MTRSLPTTAQRPRAIRPHLIDEGPWPSSTDCLREAAKAKRAGDERRYELIFEGTIGRRLRAAQRAAREAMAS